MAEQEQIKVQIIASATEATVQMVRAPRMDTLRGPEIETIGHYRERAGSLLRGACDSDALSQDTKAAVRECVVNSILEAKRLEDQINTLAKPLGPEEACQQALKFLEDDDAWEDRKRRAELRAALWATVYGRAGASGVQRDTPEATDGAAS